ncbi:uncharacterized protein LOC113386541 [Ctenocephalides felis]|uniref:uncharacterized protein LOC113386541 n=1 Tax=Ctenocephalides felis TaxID=7515 RepID=UPI000E6E44D2|nr:uncharacterized protein LOC113386541 [Ctenocephalides felis]
MADLKRQVVFLQTQLEDKERTVQLLQLQMTKYSQNRTNGLQGNQNQNQVLSNLPINGVSEDKAVNAATQTERLRPMSTGPTTYQQLGEANGLLRYCDRYNQLLCSIFFKNYDFKHFWISFSQNLKTVFRGHWIF